MLRRAVEEPVQGILGSLGYRLRRLHRLVDVRTVTNDPRSRRYVGGDVLVDAPMTGGVGLLNFSLTGETAHPIVRAARAALDAADPLAEARHTLAAFYSCAQPSGVPDRLPVGGALAQRLLTAPPWELVLPWERWDLREFQRIKGIEDAGATWRAGDPLPGGVPWAGGGPVRDSKLYEESHRTADLVQSIRYRGYRRGAHGDIHAVALYANGREWRWLVRWGQHRAAVLAALGWSHAPVRIDAEVDRRDVELWPNVRRGLYSREAALTLFDHVFDAVLPPLYDGWLAHGRASGGLP